MKLDTELKIESLKYIAAGLIGAVTPMYGLSLLATNFDPVEALKMDGILYATRGALALIGVLPGINRIPVINQSYKLFAPEYLGGLAGILLAELPYISGAEKTLKNMDEMLQRRPNEIKKEVREK